ncbi:Pyridoxamine phosphate oxidase family protein [Tolypocladium capitatum]|uniref:Pyridoxamine phosphate oxidase family protein n=1 Tax=Tolypocladium capitatum TaxID=45235 RepID=A0A2K3QLP1_9HYPO|nr:Pyridoxamine phosphate oxidase family protein [Tolypocladium capitatum]
MKLYPSLPDDLAAWAQRQPVFFTASAATHGRHINVSPKGLTDTHLAVLDPNRCAYIDRTGSGCETVAHAYENGRLCLMFVSFGSAPRILRLFCRAAVVEWDAPAFPDLVRSVARGRREAFDGARAVVVCHIWEVQTSCGYGVPRVKRALYAGRPDSGADAPATPAEELGELAVFEARPTMDHWASTKAQSNTLREYQGANNAESIDGLPGLRAARRGSGQRALWVGDVKARMRRICAETEAVAAGFVLAVVLYFILAGVRMLPLLP